MLSFFLYLTNTGTRFLIFYDCNNVWPLLSITILNFRSITLLFTEIIECECVSGESLTTSVPFFPKMVWNPENRALSTALLVIEIFKEFPYRYVPTLSN